MGHQSRESSLPVQRPPSPGTQRTRCWERSPLAMRAVTTALLPRAAPLLAALGAAQHHGRFGRRFHARPSFAGQERTWRADRPVGLDGVNRSWLPSPTELEAQPLVRRSKQFARDLEREGVVLRAQADPAP